MATVVTKKQVDRFVGLVGKAGVSKDVFQRALDEGTVARFLRGVGAGQQITVGDPIFPPPPEHGRVHYLDVTYNPKLSWSRAVREAGPDTENFQSDHRSSIWLVGNKHQSSESGQVSTKLALVNFGHDISSGHNLYPARWAWRYRLSPASTRAVLSIPKCHPTLLRVLGKASGDTEGKMISLVSYDGGEGDYGYQDPLEIVWSENSRHVDFCWPGDHGFEKYVWFVYEYRVNVVDKLEPLDEWCCM